MDIGTTIRELRKQQGLTQQDLAKKAGISSIFISQVERGNRNPTIESIKKICDALEVCPSIFLFSCLRDEDVKPEKREFFNQIKPAIIELLKPLK